MKRPLPAGAAQRLLQPPQRGSGERPGVPWRRRGAGLPARVQPVAGAAAQRLTGSRRHRRSELPARRHRACGTRRARPGPGAGCLREMAGGPPLGHGVGGWGVFFLLCHRIIKVGKELQGRLVQPSP